MWNNFSPSKAAVLSIAAGAALAFNSEPSFSQSRVHGIVVADLNAKEQEEQKAESPAIDINKLLAGGILDTSAMVRLKSFAKTLEQPSAELKLEDPPQATTGLTLRRLRPSVGVIDGVLKPVRPAHDFKGFFARDVRLPDITINLLNARTGAVAATTTSDVYGVYDLPEVPKGRYRLCWDAAANGWQNGCLPELISVSDGPAYAPIVRVSPAAKSGMRTVAGRATFEDGSPCRVLDFPSQTDFVAQVEAIGTANAAVRANAMGYYVLPQVTDSSQQVLVQCGGIDADAVMKAVEQWAEAGAGERVYYDKPQVQSVLGGITSDAVSVATSGGNRLLNLQLANERPIVVDLEVETEFGTVMRGPAGSTALVEADALDNDRLAIFWRVSGGEAEASGSVLKWRLPDRPGRYRLSAAFTDGRGGWKWISKSFQVTEDDRLPFSGKVRVAGLPLTPDQLKTLQVSVNGQEFKPAADGSFHGMIKPVESKRYVLNIDTIGAAPLSRVFHRESTSGVYDLVPAQTVLIDPREPRILRFDSQGKDNSSLVRFMPNSLVVEASGQPATGPVTAEFAYLDPNQGQMPGDYDGLSLSGADQSLISLGAVYVGLTDANGRPVNIRDGAAAELHVQVPPDAVGSPSMMPSTVPVWTYNTKTGYWEQEQKPAVLSGNTYRTQMSHFSTVNMDLGTIGDAACVRVQLDFIRTPDDRILKVSAENGLGGTQTKQVTLDQRLNAVYRLLPLTSVTFEMLHADGTPFTDFQLKEIQGNSLVDVANNTITLQPGDEMQSNVDLWPDEPFDDCVRLVVASGNITEPTDFLSRKSAATINPDKALAYYAFMDPNDDRLTLEDWLDHNGFQPSATGNGGFSFPPAANVVELAYLNHGDLGSGRKMHCRKDNDRVACVVGNYAADTDGAFNRDPASADAAGAAESGTGFATVAMEYSALEGFEAEGSFVKFFTYGEANNRARIIAAALDEENQARNHPEVCQVCHGGSMPASFPATVADVGNLNNNDTEDLIDHFQNDDPSSFREFDLGALRNLQGNQPNSTAKQLNCDYVLDSEPYQAIEDVIIGWYGDDDPGAGIDCDGFASGGETQAANVTPNAWKGSADDQLIYEEVVANVCRTCHIAQKNYDFTDPAAGGFSWNSAHSGQPYTCNINSAMPNALVTFNNYWINGYHDTMESVYGACP